VSPVLNRIGSKTGLPISILRLSRSRLLSLLATKAARCLARFVPGITLATGYAVAAEIHQQITETDALLWVQPRRRFIHDQELGIVEQRLELLRRVIEVDKSKVEEMRTIISQEMGAPKIVQSQVHQLPCVIEV